MVRLWEPSRTGEASLQNLTFAFKIVRYCGLWRTDGDTKTYTIYSFVVALNFIFAYIKLLVFCFSVAGDMSLVIETLSNVFGVTPSIVGTFLMSIYSGKFTEIVERIRAFISFANTGSEYWKYEARRHSTFGKRRLTAYYVTSGIISLLCYMLRPVVSHFFFGQEAGFPMRPLAMFDDKSMLSFCVQYLAQIFICSFFWAAVIAIDILCFNIVLSCSHQFNVLTSMILNVVNTVSEKDEFSRETTQPECHFKYSPQSTEYDDVHSNICENIINCHGCSFTVPQGIMSSEEQRSMEKALSTLSEWHQELLKTSGEMSKLLNAVMFSHYLFTSLNLCMSTYNVQNYRGTSQMISTSSILLCDFLRIFIFGWSSSELSNESLSVADAVYFCNWYDLSLSAKKTLIVMMARAQRPVVIKAGPTGSLSLETCKKLLEAAYSYLNVLNNMK